MISHGSACHLSMLRRTSALTLIASALLATSAIAQSPSGGVVVRGAAQIAQTATQSTIRQTSQRAVINWNGFDVGPTHSVVFDQPGRTSATLNRVNSVSGSVIQGAIRAPGTVIIQNTAGVIFTGSAKVDVGGLVATSQTVNAARFEADGSLNITGGEQTGARVANRGEITIGEAGLAALVGGTVENAGAILADKGTVALASGNRTTIDLGGDGLMRIVVTGNPSGDSSITNSGTIDVGEGQVLISAGNAAETLDNAINTTGIIRATSGTGVGGTVQLFGRGRGKVRIAGTIDVSGGTRGGRVISTGDTVAVETGASLDARGQIDGGEIHLGGDRLINGPLRRAQRMIVDRGSAISVDGATGTGGTVLVVGGDHTAVDGAISATGAISGGSVETFARYGLAVGDQASVTIGPGGAWRINPHHTFVGSNALIRDPDGTITPPSNTVPYEVNGSVVAQTLNGGADVTISSFQPVYDVAGNITVLGDIVWTGGGDLRMEAARDLDIDARVQSTGSGNFFAEAERDFTITGQILSGATGNLALTAGRDFDIDGTLRAGGSGALSVRARLGDIAAANGAVTNVAVSSNSGSLRMEAERGAILLGGSTGGSNSLRIYSDQGSVDLVAANRISAQGGSEDGSWVSIGGADSSGAVRLTAPDIFIEGGAGGNAFAEVTAGAGGSIVLDADQSIELREGGSQGRIAALDGASLELQAPRQIWDGAVSANDGGDVLISGAITAGVAPVFRLSAGADFTFAATAPDGMLSSFTSDVGFFARTSGSGMISIDAPLSAGQIELVSEESVTLGTRARLRGTGPGDTLVVTAGRGFVNGIGPDVFETTDPAGRWLLYLDTFNGIAGSKPPSGTFDLYGRSFAAAPPTTLAEFAGNRIVYGETPTLTITAGSGSRIYGGAPVDLGTTLTGLRPGDTAGTALSGAPAVVSAGNLIGAEVGDYTATALAAASAQGYALVYVDGTLSVDPAALTVTVNGSTRTYGAANPVFSASYDGFVLGQDASDLPGTLDFAPNAASNSNVGFYSVVASGLGVGNYEITYVDGALRVDPAALAVTVNDATRTYGAANPAFSASYDGFVLGQDASDLPGTLDFVTNAASNSNVGTYRIAANGLRNGNYEIDYVDGALRIDPAALTVTANDASRGVGAPDPAFGASFDGFVLGQNQGDLGGALDFTTDATVDSPAGTYVLAVDGLGSRNYAITYVAGSLSVTPVPTPPEQVPAINALTAPFARGVPPYTPGDASFRTTTAEAPPAIDNPFGLTYSLGDVVQLAPEGAAGIQGVAPASGAAPGTDGFVAASGGGGTDGFTPASGGGAGPANSSCGGSVNQGTAAVCALTTSPESFWSTSEGAL